MCPLPLQCHTKPVTTKMAELLSDREPTRSYISLKPCGYRLSPMLCLPSMPSLPCLPHV